MAPLIQLIVTRASLIFGVRVPGSTCTMLVTRAGSCAAADRRRAAGERGAEDERRAAQMADQGEHVAGPARASPGTVPARGRHERNGASRSWRHGGGSPPG
jgi:hypothetical protein